MSPQIQPPSLEPLAFARGVPIASLSSYLEALTMAFDEPSSIKEEWPVMPSVSYLMGLSD